MVSTEKSELIGYAKSICSFSIEETKIIQRVLKKSKYFPKYFLLNKIYNKIKYFLFFNRLRKKIYNKISFEVLAYYEFLILIYLVNIFSIPDNEIKYVQLELEKALDQEVAKHKKLKSVINKYLYDGSISKLVGRYMKGDKSLIEVNESEFLGIAKIVNFDGKLDDFILRTYLISFFRLLNSLALIENNTVKKNINVLAIWIVHSTSVNNFRSVLKKVFKESFPDRIK
jgi:hypothetical protein